jgi:hypothetical protein
LGHPPRCARHRSVWMHLVRIRRKPDRSCAEFVQRDSNPRFLKEGLTRGPDDPHPSLPTREKSGAEKGLFWEKFSANIRTLCDVAVRGSIGTWHGCAPQRCHIRTQLIGAASVSTAARAIIAMKDAARSSEIHPKMPSGTGLMISMKRSAWPTAWLGRILERADFACLNSETRFQ